MGRMIRIFFVSTPQTQVMKKRTKKIIYENTRTLLLFFYVHPRNDEGDYFFNDEVMIKLFENRLCDSFTHLRLHRYLHLLRPLLQVRVRGLGAEPAAFADCSSSCMLSFPGKRRNENVKTCVCTFCFIIDYLLIYASRERIFEPFSLNNLYKPFLFRTSSVKLFARYTISKPFL